MSLFILLAVVGLFVALAATALVGLILKAVFWLLFLPFRLLFSLVFGLGGLLIGVVIAPVLLLAVGAALIVAILAALVALLLPLAPVILLALVGWAIYKGTTRPSPAI